MSNLGYHNDLVLTKPGYKTKYWDLPYFFKKANISYHKGSSWKADCFESVSRGQEFVIDDNEEVEEWAKKLVEKRVAR